MAARALARNNSASAISDHVSVPQLHVLLGERHVLPGGVAPGGPARFHVKHECHQPKGLRLVGQQLCDELPEKQGLLGQVAAGGVGSAGVGPAFREGRVDGVQHRAEPARQLLALGNPKRNPGLVDLVLGTHQALAHGRR